MALITQDNRDWIEAPSIADVIMNKAEKELSNLLNEEIIKQLYQNGVISELVYHGTYKQEQPRLGGKR